MKLAEESSRDDLSGLHARYETVRPVSRSDERKLASYFVRWCSPCGCRNFHRADKRAPILPNCAFKALLLCWTQALSRDLELALQRIKEDWKVTAHRGYVRKPLLPEMNIPSCNSQSIMDSKLLLLAASLLRRTVCDGPARSIQIAQGSRPTRTGLSQGQSAARIPMAQ
jgi:hypothetical protein